MSQSRTLLENIRRRLPHYLDSSVAWCLGTHDVAVLQRIISGSYVPTTAEQDALAKRLQLTPAQHPETAAAET
jgi:hypothetical protein